MKQLTIGILAHVDAGKTTLSEALLYLSGQTRKLGRVDHGDAFLDTGAQERERGITIFSKQARLTWGDMSLTLLDTPGHADFSAEMERTLQVLDYALLVVSGPDGVRGRTETLWKLLARQNVPVFLFINKMDLPGADRGAVLSQLRARLGEGFVDFGAARDELLENAALCDDALLERYLDGVPVTDADLSACIVRRELFPCLFGAALKLTGVEALLDALARYCLEPDWPRAFGARVFKVSRDEKGERLTWLKVTGGTLKARAALSGGQGDGRWEEKANQLRLYSGGKFRVLDEAAAGTVCAVTGLTHTRPGEGLGAEGAGGAPLLEPVLRFQVIPGPGVEARELLRALRQLEEEDPTLRVLWNGAAGEIHIRLMGEIQRDVLSRVLLDRFGLAASFGPGSILYRETIAAPAEGVGHFEPLRHYAEVHLLLEPLARGAGLEFATACPEDVLDRNWQRLILTHLAEKTHVGVLTGSPVTDLRITLLTGRAHLKHTEGGDFRQATYRAVRQGLRQAESVLLEPWYSLVLEVPAECLGRAMADVRRMGGRFGPAENCGDRAVLRGSVPASELGDYHVQVAAYTKGQGRLSCSLQGYEPCHNAQEVMARIGYDPDRDEDNPCGSVFCAHGGGFSVPWDQVREHMHLDSGWRPPAEDPPPFDAPAPRPATSYSANAKMDRELEAIFTRTYGAVKPRDFRPAPKAAPPREKQWKGLKPSFQGEEYLLVDGYNIIHAWDDLSALARVDLDGARKRLMDLLCSYQGWRRCHVILVFDAYKVKGGRGSVERYHNIHVVYTKEAETADMYIEKTTYEIAKDHRVRVATSDALEQVIILGHGARRVSAREFRFELDEAVREMRKMIEA